MRKGTLKDSNSLKIRLLHKQSAQRGSLQQNLLKTDFYLRSIILCSLRVKNNQGGTRGCDTPENNQFSFVWVCSSNVRYSEREVHNTSVVIYGQPIFYTIEEYYEIDASFSFGAGPSM